VSAGSLTARQVQILETLRNNAKGRDKVLLQSAIGGSLELRDIETVCTVINDEFLMRGIKDDWEPNEYGLELESLLMR
jgi:hypothetical protein